MRIGFLTHLSEERLRWARSVGLGSIELLMGEAGSDPLASRSTDDQHCAIETLRSLTEELGLRISCIGGFYTNNLDPAREDESRRRIELTISLALQLGVDRIAGFAGRWPIEAPLEDSMQRMNAFWPELVRMAGDAGVRIAFEHCPMGKHHLPPGGINCICTPAMWERVFSEPWADQCGIEWDASHLMCMGIDPVRNIQKYGQRILHVHAKDAHVDRDMRARFGIYHPGVLEHCFPGLGDAPWPIIIKELIRAGYDSDLNLEGWHDSVYNDRSASDGEGVRSPLEDRGLLIGLAALKDFVDWT